MEELCIKFGIKNYTINPDGSIDVNGDVYLDSKRLTELPLKFNKVSGDFNCQFNNLTSLVGCPKEVGGHFRCNNNLTSLEHCPKIVGGSLYCRHNKITDLTGVCKFNGDFYCGENPIGSIFNNVEYEFIYAFQVYQVIKGKEIHLKRLNHVMQLWNLPIDLEKIEKHYKLI